MEKPVRKTTVSTDFTNLGFTGVARQKQLLRKRHITAPLEFAKKACDRL
jgi:hypothetical protein